jgi:transposase-like protein
LAKGSGVALWEIAQALGISEPTLTRRWRQQLSLEDQKEIVEIINRLKAKKSLSV